MSRRKLVRSIELDKAVARSSALKSIDPNLDLGNGLKLPDFEAKIADYQKTLNDYNTTLSNVDALYDQLNAQEKTMQDLSERFLAGVASKFGKDSVEYEMAGGTKKSETKRRKPTAKNP